MCTFPLMRMIIQTEADISDDEIIYFFNSVAEAVTDGVKVLYSAHPPPPSPPKIRVSDLPGIFRDVLLRRYVLMLGYPRAAAFLALYMVR